LKTLRFALTSTVKGSAQESGGQDQFPEDSFLLDRLDRLGWVDLCGIELRELGSVMVF
jgi:hypothetical protein